MPDRNIESPAKIKRAAIENNGNDKTNLPTIIYCHFICIFNAWNYHNSNFNVAQSYTLTLTHMCISVCTLPIASYHPLSRGKREKNTANLSANIKYMCRGKPHVFVSFFFNSFTFFYQRNSLQCIQNKYVYYIHAALSHSLTLKSIYYVLTWIRIILLGE